MNPFPEDARRVLLRAIQIEARNGSIYDSLSDIFQGYDESVTALFNEMAAEERQHGAQLVERYRERFGVVPSPREEPKEVIEPVDLDDAEALVFDSMSVEQALRTGLRTEESAREFYRKETLHASDPELQKMYRELAEFEETHVRVLQEKLVERTQANSTFEVKK
jgi:erythrin-vacuolar iron transport family protein